MEKDINTDHGEKFQFNSDVSGCFSDMLTRSIPNYDIMRELIYRLSDPFASNTNVLDIGTSLGDSIHKLAQIHKGSDFIGLEDSNSMIEKANERFKSFRNVEIRKHNMKNRFSGTEQYGLILSVLTIQFIPIEYRLQIIDNIYNLLKFGGAFIFVEKVIGGMAEIDSLFNRTYYGIKEDNGYPFEEIQRKKLALEGVLVPVTSKWNEELLKDSGFRKIECFWRCLNFSGWIAIK